MYLVNCFTIWTHNPHINVKKSSLSNLEHQTHLGARLHFVKEAFLSVSIHCDEVRPGDRHKICQNQGQH